jgi:hypothetical protein
LPIDANTWSGASGSPTAERGDGVAVRPLFDDAELVGLRQRRAQRGHGHGRAGLDVLVEHLLRIHPVDVVGAEHRHVVRLLVVEQVEVLIDRVGRPREPVRPAPHLRRHRRDVVAEQRRQPPRDRDVPVERVALVLREHDDAPEAGVDEVGEGEVDQPVVAAERYGRLGAISGQRGEPLALAARQHDPENVHQAPSAWSTICFASARIRSRRSSPSRLSAYTL